MSDYDLRALRVFYADYYCEQLVNFRRQAAATYFFWNAREARGIVGVRGRPIISRTLDTPEDTWNAAAREHVASRGPHLEIFSTEEGDDNDAELAEVVRQSRDTRDADNDDEHHPEASSSNKF